MLGLLVIRSSFNIISLIGLIFLLGLLNKNALLLMDYANLLRQKGWQREEALIETGIIRFRPILMTSFAFILGVVPLLNATGAGAASRRALGTAVFGGMVGATILGLFFIPVLYFCVQRIAEWIKPMKPVHHQTSASGSSASTHA
jgi:multidrug efflux pump subunit AcrB